MRRPLLSPDLTPLTRGEDSVQLGADPERGRVLTGLSAGHTRLLTLLDGARTMDELVVLGARLGLGQSEVRSFVRLLDAEHLLYRPVGDPRRQTSRVVVRGHGELPGSLVDVLRAEGVGQVLGGRYSAWPPDSPADARAVPAPEPRRSRRPVSTSTPPADLEIVCSPHPLTAGELTGHARASLPVVVDAVGAVVGPLLVPGSGPCARCLDLARADRDPGWPRVAAQLYRADGDHRVSTTPGLAAIVSGLVTLTSLSWLDDGVHDCGLAIEVRGPTPAFTSRRWTRHPVCECAPAAAPGGSCGTMVR